MRRPEFRVKEKDVGFDFHFILIFRGFLIIGMYLCFNIKLINKLSVQIKHLREKLMVQSYLIWSLKKRALSVPLKHMAVAGLLWVSVCALCPSAACLARCWRKSRLAGSELGSGQ